MAVRIERLERQFVFSGVKLPDPNPDFTVEQVRDMYVNTYPELATAAVEGPTPVNSPSKPCISGVVFVVLMRGNAR
jgi:PRTRC genetic system protein C